MSNDAPIKIAEPVKILGGVYKKTMSVAEGVVSAPKTLIFDNLPEDVTEDMIKKVLDYRDKSVASFNLAVGEVAHAAMKADAKLDTVTAGTTFHKDNISVVVHRSREYPNPSDPGNKTVVAGASRVGYVARAAANSGELKKTRQHVSNLFADLAD